MLIHWNEKTAAWFEAASEYTGFHEKLASLLLSTIPLWGSLVDLGCGVGLIDFALSAHFAEITCIDKSEEALLHLCEMAEARDIRNIRTQCADARTASGTWDAVLMVFFGRLEEDIRQYLSLCNDRVVAVVHKNAHFEPASGGARNTKCNTVENTAEGLTRLGVRFSVQEHSIEYGQPFSSRQDACDFVTAYKKHPQNSTIDEYLDARLIETGDARYPLYLPNMKHFGIFTIRREENENI